jgi:two-component system, NtrC family, response regulator GlrR
LSRFTAARVLLVDDDADDLRMLDELVRGMGHATTAVHSADAGIAYVRLGGVDVVVCDLELAGWPGPRLLWQIQRVDPRIATIVLAAERSDAHTEHARALGAFRLLVRPPEGAALRAAIDDALAARELND